MILGQDSNYILVLHSDGVYLFAKTDDIAEIVQGIEGLHVGVAAKKLEGKPYLVKFTLMGSVYDFIFAIVDALVNRSLQQGFSFETDAYARHLRIAFALLVPKLDLSFGLSYDRAHLQGKKPAEFDVSAFMAIKRLLDSDNSKKKQADKEKFLKLGDGKKLTKHYADIQAALEKALDGYASDDSDVEGEESEDDDDSDDDFIYSIKSHTDRKQIAADMAAINRFLAERDPESDSLDVADDGTVTIDGDVLPTQFVFAGFRGVNHMPIRFSDEARRVWRSAKMQARRSELPYFSEGILETGLDFYRDADAVREAFLTDDNELLPDLIANAGLLEAAMLAVKDGGYILTRGLTNDSLTDVRLFGNFLHFLQHVYSNGIIKSQRLLREYLTIDGSPIILPNAYNPFVSESEAADHALRYTLGLKSLYQPAALHAHYRSDGSRSFPYLGEVYVSIRGMEVFAGDRRRHQLRRLESMHRVNPAMMIGPELESTGFAWLPNGEVVFSETVKCPSFKGHWTRQHKEKYGLSKSQFRSFKQRLERSHSKKNRNDIEQDIIEHLIKFHSQRLLRRAAEFSRSQGKVMVFLDAKGQLTFDLPKRDMSATQDADAKAIRQEVERACYEKIKKQQPDAGVKLTSKTLKVYHVSPDIVTQVIKELKEKHPDKMSAYDRFQRDEERLRTPPSRTSNKRSASTSSSAPSPYKVRASAAGSMADIQRRLFSAGVGRDDPDGASERLLETVRDLELECQDTPRDGDCLYHALIHQLRSRELVGGNFTVAELRRQIRDHYATNWDSYYHEKLDDTEYPDGAETVLQKTRWGGHQEIAAVARLFQVTIVVINGESGAMTFHRQADAEATLILGYEGGRHYQTVLLGEDDELPAVIVAGIEAAEVDDFEEAALGDAASSSEEEAVDPVLYPK